MAGAAPTAAARKARVSPNLRAEPALSRRRRIALTRSGSVRGCDMGIIWTIIIGFFAGVIAKFLMPGPNEPAGFIWTTLLGIAGAIVATYLGRAIGWYGPDGGAGFIGAIVGAVIVLFIYGLLARRSSTY